MAKPNPAQDRRRWFRMDVSGKAALWRDGHLVGRYQVRDLSSGGCLLQNGPACAPGKEYWVVLRVGEGLCLRQRVSIVHEALDSSGSWALGVAFLNESSAVNARMEQLLLRDVCYHGPAQLGRVLVAHYDHARSLELCGLLDRLGYQAVEADSFADAVWELENGPMDFHAAFVSHALADAEGETVLKYLASNYPDVRRVLIEDAPEAALHTPSRYVDMVVPDAFGHALLQALNRNLTA